MTKSRVQFCRVLIQIPQIERKLEKSGRKNQGNPKLLNSLQHNHYFSFSMIPCLFQAATAHILTVYYQNISHNDWSPAVFCIILY